MKLLWKLREDYCFGEAPAAKNEKEETRRFLNFIEQSIKSLSKSSPKEQEIK